MQDEAEKSRRFVGLFNCVYDYSPGTLWRAREDLLKERVHRYNQASDRYCHPAMSIRRFPIASLERIPMLVGSSKPRGGRLQVTGVFSAGGPDTISYFGNTFAPLSPQDFTDIPSGFDRSRVTGSLLDCKRVIVNWHKPRVSPEERRTLLMWMSRKGF